MLKRIAMIVDRQVGYREAVLRGVWKYAEETGNWVCRGCDLIDRQVRAFRSWEPHGVIGGFWDREIALDVMTWNVPTVDVFDWYPELPCPRFSFDSATVGKLAADHLIGRGLRHFGFVGETHWGWVGTRLQGFATRLVNEGQSAPASFSLESGATAWGYWGKDMDAALREWIVTLPRPVGIMAGNDDSGFRVLEVCRAVGLRVPDDVAVVGVDNDDFLCNLAHPPLSSIDTRPERIGYDAAKLLYRMLNGERVPPGQHLLQPVDVVARQSTDVLAIDDPELASAIRYIRTNATRKINVRDVLENIPMRRRTMERRFQSVLGHGVLEEIRVARLTRVRELLGTSDLSMPAIARRCGFGNAERLSKVFREQTGQTPSDYRKQFRPRE